MFDPIFDLLAGLLAWFYSLVPSYGFAIIALTCLVLIVFAPLTYRSTKSMVAMRRLQPKVRRLQRKHSGDKERLNQEMMALYQEHGVSPLSGCLPLLIQSPVFIVMFQVLRGITRRSSTIGASAGDVVVGRELEDPNFVAADLPLRNFNPEYLSEDSELYKDLIQDNEMMWLGLDLSRTPLEVIRDSISSGLPYILMIAIVAFLGWFQQRQIAGRMTGEVSSQQQLIMRVMPWFLPIFAFSMPAGLVLYFIVSSLIRVTQQAYITRAVYGNEELTKPLELDDDDDEFDDDGEDESPFAALFGGANKAKTAAPAPSSRHGSRRPTSGKATPRASQNRARPPRDSATSGAKERNNSSGSRRTTQKGSSKSTAASADDNDGKGIWGRARRSAPTTSEEPARPASRRVTPKGDNRGKRK